MSEIMSSFVLPPPLPIYLESGPRLGGALDLQASEGTGV
jgi:hypothetical protein